MPNRWAPNSAKARAIRVLEDAMACRMTADVHIRNVVTRMIQRARTVEDKENVEELLDARIALQDQRLYLQEFHPDALIEGDEQWQSESGG